MRKFFALFICILSIIACDKDVCDLPPEQCHIYTNEDNCETQLEEAEIIAADLNQYLHPITDSDPERDFEDLAALGNLVGETQFLGLGEATHGSLEFFQMKDRVFRQLVIEHEFNAIGFEATWGGALYVNDYIINGVGSAESAIEKMQFWTWSTQEVKALIEWMHDYNLTQDENEKIFFFGFDMQSGIEERYWINKYLEENLPDIKQLVITPINDFISVANFSSYSNLDANTQQNYRTGLVEAKNLFEDNKDDLVQSSSQKEYDLIAYAFEILIQFEDILDSSSGFSRDYYMAINSTWIQSYLGEASKVALWAHNAHVTKKGIFVSQGSFLQDTHGEKYKCIGFSFSKGSFRAINSAGQLNEFNFIPEPECDSGNQVLNFAEANNYYLIFDEMDKEGLSYNYFNKYNSYLSVGSLYNPNSFSPYYRYIQTEAYDALIYFNQSTAAIPL